MKRRPPRPIAFEGHGGLTLRAEVVGDPRAVPALLLHGGGQTRHSWTETAQVLAHDGWQVVSVDLRGHGESDWATGGAYEFQHFAEDVREITRQLARPPVLVGASLGGLAALLAQGSADDVLARGIVLVDVAPRMEPEGVSRILEFMQAHPDGFSSIDECAEAVAAYNPHRARPPSSAGLAKNLRRGEDGRWRWHWDPEFLAIDEPADGTAEAFDRAARALDLPTLLVRGGLSDVLSEEGAAEFLELCPHAEYVNVTGAAHMVAGDKNDAFTGSVLSFIEQLD